MTEPAYETARAAVKIAGAFLLVCLLGAGVATLPACSILQPQSEIAQLCTEITDRNAGVSCVKAGYAAITDVANVTATRLEQGRISGATARDIGSQLEKLYDAVEIAEMAVFAGNLGDAEGRMNAVIELLTVLEGSLQ